MIRHLNSSTARETLIETLRSAITDLGDSRELLHQFTLKNIRVRYKQAVMGLAWAVLMPILVVCAGLIIRYVTATLSGSAMAGNAIATVAVKSVPWSFFAGSLSFAVTSLTTNGNLITKIYFPREVLPIAAILAQGFDSLVAAAAIVLALPFVGVGLHWSLLWVPLLLLVLIMFTSAAALLLSVANLYFRDVKYIVQIVLTYGIFFTPVLYEPAMLGLRGSQIAMLNPLTPLLEGLRLSIVEGHDLLQPLTQQVSGGTITVWSPWLLLASTVLTLVGVVLGLIVFHRAQSRFAEMA